MSASRLAGGLIAAAAGGLLARVVLATDRATGLAPHVAARIDETAVSSGVTAVLLDFRSYDTMLEVAVLVAAVVGIWSLERGRPAVPAPIAPAAEPVLDMLLRGLVPIIVLTSVYLVWRGAHAPGGAFQGGALLGGAVVLVLAAGALRIDARVRRAVRALVAAGLGSFVAVAGATLLATGALLGYPPATAYALILVIEAAVAVCVAVALADLFVDVPSISPGPARPEQP